MRIKHVNLVSKYEFYTINELAQLLGCTTNCIRKYIKKGLRYEAENDYEIWGGDVIEFNEKLKNNTPKRAKNQMNCHKCKAPVNIANNEITVKIKNEVKYNNGEHQIIYKGYCADCGTLCTLIGSTKQLSELSQYFKIKYE